MTQEYRHRTATPTFLTTPAPRPGRRRQADRLRAGRRGRSRWSSSSSTIVVVGPIYAGARGAAPALDADNLATMASVLLALVIYAVIGVGLGALLRNQVGAIVGGLVYLFVIEPIIRSVPATAGAYKWMPGGGAGGARPRRSRARSCWRPWQGGLLLLGLRPAGGAPGHPARGPPRRRLSDATRGRPAPLPGGRRRRPAGPCRAPSPTPGRLTRTGVDSSLRPRVPRRSPETKKALDPVSSENSSRPSAHVPA